MSTMIERVARAICESVGAYEEVWESFIPEAKAAIEAMRNPTEDMLLARLDVSGHGSDDEWEAMINAALMEKAND